MPIKTIRKIVHDVIYESDTRAGKTFDIILLFAILISTLVVMLDSVVAYNIKYGTQLKTLEWIITILFTIEYFFRIYSADSRKTYLSSFLGVTDLIAIVPTYLVIFIPGIQYLRVIRTIRLLRIFRILKLGRYVEEANTLVKALKASQYKITVFLSAVLTIVTIMGTVLYMVESPETGFTSIPRSVYWAIVTLTTVGYGDIAPATVVGQIIASMIMIIGYAIIAVPTGIITAELTHKAMKSPKNETKTCLNCSNASNDEDAVYCKSCGKRLEKSTT